MKITKRQLKRIIREELKLSESMGSKERQAILTELSDAEVRNVLPDVYYHLDMADPRMAKTVLRGAEMRLSTEPDSTYRRLAKAIDRAEKDIRDEFRRLKIKTRTY